MRSSPRKPKLESVTVEDWCLANMRIMNIMMGNRTLDQSSLRDYMSYTIKICELFRYYHRVSVLQYDREYRHMQSVHNFRWGTDAPHLFHVHLVRKTEARRVSSTGQKGARAPGEGQDIICRLYNTQRGCSYGTGCKFKHTCNVQGCTQMHPRYQHSSPAANSVSTPTAQTGGSRH